MKPKMSVKFMSYGSLNKYTLQDQYNKRESEQSALENEEKEDDESTCILPQQYTVATPSPSHLYGAFSGQV